MLSVIINKLILTRSLAKQKKDMTTSWAFKILLVSEYGGRIGAIDRISVIANLSVLERYLLLEHLEYQAVDNFEQWRRRRSQVYYL